MIRPESDFCQAPPLLVTIARLVWLAVGRVGFMALIQVHSRHIESHWHDKDCLHNAAHKNSHCLQRLLCRKHLRQRAVAFNLNKFLMKPVNMYHKPLNLREGLQCTFMHGTSPARPLFPTLNAGRRRLCSVTRIFKVSAEEREWKKNSQHQIARVHRAIGAVQHEH